MRSRHAEVAAAYKARYGFVLSEQVALLAALLTSLDDDERAAALDLELSPGGVTTWFIDGVDWPVKPGLDIRLHHRYWCDAPESVTIMLGGADGLHFSLFHDANDKPAWLGVRCFARDDGTTEAVFGRHNSIIKFLWFHVQRGITDGVACAALLPALEELLPAATDVTAREHRPKKPKPFVRLETVDGVGPILASAQVLPTDAPSKAARLAAYAADDHTAVERWVAEAQQQLSAGAPALALLIGRDLFFLRTRWQDAAVLLLATAYEAVGRPNVAEIVRMHAAHRELASVDVQA